MTPYYIVFVLSLLFFSIPNGSFSNKLYGSTIFYVISASILSLFAAFRSLEGGGDIFSYLNNFQNISFRLSELLKDNVLFNEIGYQYINFFIYKISNSNIFFLFSISSIVLFFTYKAILKNSNYPVMSFICFILLNFYNFHFNGIRQAITIAMSIYSLKFIFDRNLNKFFIMVFIGFLIHKTMLIMLPIYYLYNCKLTTRLVLGMLAVITISAVLLDPIISSLSVYDPRYSTFGNENEKAGGTGTLILNFLLLSWLVLIRYFNKVKLQQYDFYILTMIIVMAVNFVSVVLKLNPSGIVRITLYFTQLLIFSLPISVMSFSSLSNRNVVKCVMLTFLLFYYYLSVSSFTVPYPYNFSI